MRSVINSGELNEMLTFQKKESSIDENGFPVETVINVYNDLWCKAKTVSTREYMEVMKTSGLVMTYKFIISRDGVNIDNEMFISYDDKEWNIKHVHHMDDFYYELTAELNQ